MNPTLKSDIDSGKPVKVPPLAEALSLSCNGLYLAIARNEVESIRIGRAIRVPAREAARLLGMTVKEAA